jgi:hypothetical protein
LQDLRDGEFPSGFDLVLFASGELNTFQPAQAQTILTRAAQALRVGGRLIIEVHSEAFVRTLGDGGRSWYTAGASVFSDVPHRCLKESAWHAEQAVATERYFVVSIDGGDVVSYISTTQAYTEEQYVALLQQAGFGGVTRYPSLTGERAHRDDELFVSVAQAGAT